MAGNGSSSSNSSGNGTRTDTNINNGNWLGFSLSPNNNSNSSSSMEIMQMELLPNNSTSHHNNYQPHPHHSNFDHQTQTCSTTSTAAVAFIPSSVPPPPTSMFLTPLHHNFNPSSNGNGGQYSCFAQGRGGGSSLGEISGSTSFHPENHYPSSQQLTVMPIKSDGSLCIMEALTRSSQPPPPQGMMMVQSNASPKLENFFEGRGGAAQHQHHDHYHQDERDHQVAMALSLDSIYYNHHHQNQHEAEQQQHNRNHHHYPISLEIFQQQQPTTTTTTYFSSAVPCSQSCLITQSPHHSSMVVEGDQQIKVDHTHTHQTISDCDAQQMANWISTHHQQAGGGGAAMGTGVNDHHHHHFGDVHSNSSNTNSNNNFITENLTGDQSSSSSIGCCGDLQSLRLSMSPGSQSSTSITTTTAPSAHNLTCTSSNGNDQSAAVVEMATGKKRAHQPAVSSSGKAGGGNGGSFSSSTKQPVNHRKSIDTFGQRTSQYRGVTKHRWTGRYEAHLWDNSCKKEGQTRKGRQVYLGGYDMEEKAARAYDLAALKYWGPSTHINFPIENYKEEVEEMKGMTRQEYVAHLRRKSSGFSRGASMYRGVTRHHQHGRWQARIGRVAGNKDLYLGTFSTQEEAAEAYDIAAIKFRGINAVTNFNITRYDVDKIMDSNTLLAGEQAKKIPSPPPPPLLLNPLPRTTAIDPITTMTTNQTAINPSPSSTPLPTDWTKMVLNDYHHHHYQNHNHQQPDAGQCMGKNDGDVGINGIGNRTSNPNWDRFMGIEPLNSTHQQQAATTSVLAAAVDESSNKVGSVQFSNASSIVTSLNSSREGSPCRSGSSPNNNNNMNGLIIRPSPPIAWIPSSAQLRPPHPSAAAAVAISMAHNMPVFAAWGDA